MAMGDSVVPSPVPAATAKIKTKRFWNWKLIVLEFIVFAIGVYGFVGVGNRFLRVLGLGVALFGLWILIREFRGLSIGPKMISLPGGRAPAFPLLSRGRRTVPTDNLRELTVTSRWCSFEIVRIEGGFGSEVLVFQSRGQRLRFMSAVERICPNVQMFRQKPPEAR